jgi:hypothetical protein
MIYKALGEIKYPSDYPIGRFNIISLLVATIGRNRNTASHNSDKMVVLAYGCGSVTVFGAFSATADRP